ncbi:MAG: MOSC domain-containing protein [Gemmatimonadales bacterium]|nr:MOSC domain-containing protein [Gemmatimonadales bacterium]
MSGHVVAVHAKPVHAFSKDAQPWIDLVQDRGVAGDAHFGVTVKHRSRVARDPSQPNLRQVHLLQHELLHELERAGMPVAPGQLGENITTSNLDLLSLRDGTVLKIGGAAVVQVTGLRNPCAQIEAFRPGLLAAVLEKGADGSLIRKAGIMAIVLASGRVAPGDPIVVMHIPDHGRALEPV